MYSPDFLLTPLETLLIGYCACLRANEINETYEGRTFDPRAFTAWLYQEKGWSGSLGFAHAIEENSAGAEAAFERFFRLVENYRFGVVPQDLLVCSE